MLIRLTTLPNPTRSALDAESEHLVQDAIEKAMVGRTVIVIAHRLSTVVNADRIVVVDNNAIVDVGSHHELLGRCKKYEELVRRQLQSSSDGAAQLRDAASKSE